jgi:hypothetical protein
MAKSLPQLIHEIYARMDAAETRLDKLDKITENHQESLEVLAATPAPRRGAQVPPTALPDTLSELEIGRQPKGT